MRPHLTMTDECNPSEGEDHLSDQLELIAEACGHLPGSLQRRRCLDRLIRDIIKSGKLWKENTPYYPDALQQTWIYFANNLCEATTAKRPYDPETSRLTTWLNAYLRNRLLDFRLEEQREIAERSRRRIVSLQGVQDEETLNSIDKIEAVTDSFFYLQEILEWIEIDPNNELKSRHVRGKPQINCQVLLQRQCSSPQSLQELAKEFGCAASTLYDLLNNDCRHLLQQFCEDQGYQINIPGVYSNER